MKYYPPLLSYFLDGDNNHRGLVLGFLLLEMISIQ
jgi:hypothetical protein